MDARNLFLCYFLVLISCQSDIFVHGGFVQWLFSSPDENSRVTSPEDADGEKKAMPSGSSVPFEMTIGDEKFQLQASFVNELSPLDYCHHKVVHNLQSSCEQMSEEQLGKLSVHLLNCQLEAERRETYPCTNDQTLAQCTQLMDATVWNAYQIVSNRARAMCYAARQQQFRMRTEMTVNTLVTSTESQLLSMRRMEDAQNDLKSITADTLNQVQESHDRMIDTQGHLERSQAQIASSMTSNMYALMREKALIAAGNQELTEMTEAIKDKLDSTSEQIKNQEVQQKSNHEELLRDLDTIRMRAKELLAKIDASTQDVLRYQENTRKHYEETLDNLSRINSTIANLFAVVLQQKEVLQSFIHWVVSFIGGTGDSMTVLWVFFMHVGYLALAALSASFLQTPPFTRLLLLVIVPLNAMAQLKGNDVQGLSFASMTALIILTIFGNWSLSFAFYLWNWIRSNSTDSLSSHPIPLPSTTDPSPVKAICSGSALMSQIESPQTESKTDVQKLITVLENLYESGALSPPLNRDKDSFDAAVPHIYEVISTPSQAKRDLMESLVDSTVDTIPDPPSRRSSLSGSTTSSTPSGLRHRPLCLSTTKNNRPCKLPSADGSAFCHKHRVF